MLCSIGFIAKHYGVSPSTIRRWVKLGYIRIAGRTFGGHRRFDVPNEVSSEQASTRKHIAYARVSSHDQKEDLTRQSARLREAADTGVATGLVYVSDHGESLGENGLFLHGAPYWMAPAEQIEVPGVLWLSDNYRRTFGIDYERIVQKAKDDVRHDHLYHTVLGLL